MKRRRLIPRHSITHTTSTPRPPSLRHSFPLHGSSCSVLVSPLTLTPHPPSPRHPPPHRHLLSVRLVHTHPLPLVLSPYPVRLNMNSLRPPTTADEQPSSAPVAFHSRQRSRSMTREMAPSAPSTPSPLAPPSPSSPSSDAIDGALLSPRSSLKALMRQVEFYFSNANLWKDAFLLTEMTKDPQQFVPLSVVVTFKKVSSLHPPHPRPLPPFIHLSAPSASAPPVDHRTAADTACLSVLR